MANSSGTTVWRWEQHEPFGLNAPDEDPDANSVAFEFPLRFPGQYADKETNLFYNYFRDYDSALGGYVQSDPIGLQGGMNTYIYVGDDPLRFVDFLGNSKTGGQRSIGGNDPAVSGVNKQSTPQQIQNAINEAQKVVDDPKTPAARKRFLRGWIKVAKRGFTRSFCPPFLEDLLQALASQQCMNGDMASCTLLINMDPDLLPNGI